MPIYNHQGDDAACKRVDVWHELADFSEPWTSSFQPHPIPFPPPFLYFNRLHQRVVTLLIMLMKQLVALMIMLMNPAVPLMAKLMQPVQDCSICPQQLLLSEVSLLRANPIRTEAQCYLYSLTPSFLTPLRPPPSQIASPALMKGTLSTRVLETRWIKLSPQVLVDKCPCL